MLSSLFCRSARASQLNSRLFFRSFANSPRNAANLPRPKGPPSMSQTVVERGKADKVQRLVNEMINAGRNEIYKNNVARGYVTACLSICISSYGAILYLYGTKLWDFEEAKRRGLHWGVPIAYGITMFCWGLFAAYAFTRTFGLVKSIKLIKNSGGRVLLETSIRRPLPFVRPEVYVSEPTTLSLNKAKLYNAALYDNLITAPEGNSIITRVTRAMFYMPFHNIRKALGGVGLVPMRVGEPGSQRLLNLDIDGQFSKGGQDLLDLAEDTV